MTNAIDLRQFRYFLALSEELHFGRAALRLHISQPPLSRQIQQLESQLGVELFIRSTVGVQLTPAGEAFLPEVRRTLIQAEKAIQAARNAMPLKCGTFSIGYTTVFDRSKLPNVVDELQVSFPLWNIHTVNKRSVSLLNDIRKGNLDAAFVTLHSEAVGLKTELIFDEPMILALPSSHPLAKKREVEFSDLASEPIFWFKRRLNPGYYDYCFDYFKKINFTPRIIPEPEDHHLLLGEIAQGKGFALMSASLKNIKRKGVAFRPLRYQDTPLTMGMSVAYLEQNQSEILRAFLRLIYKRF